MERNWIKSKNQMKIMCNIMLQRNKNLVKMYTSFLLVTALFNHANIVCISFVVEGYLLE